MYIFDIGLLYFYLLFDGLVILKKKKIVLCSEGICLCFGLLMLYVYILFFFVICCRGILLFYIVLVMYMLIGIVLLVFLFFIDLFLFCEFEYFINSLVFLCYFLLLVMIFVVFV